MYFFTDTDTFLP